VPGRDGLKRCLAALTFAPMLLIGANAAASLAGTPAEYLARMDLDGDGRIALREYQDYLSRGFVQMDRDGNGVLDASELPAGTRSRRAPTLESHLRSLAAVFDRQDINNDGHLDARELAAPLR
jgi:hypothetical protein